MASFWLEFEQGGQVRQIAFEQDSISVGRDRSSDFVLDHPTVSRQHALIVHQGGGFQLVVLSRGGLTAVEGKPVQSQEVTLYDGTMITLGQHSFRFRSQYAPPKPSTSSVPHASLAATGGNQQAPPPGPVAPQEDKGGAGIVSWDEIAASSEAYDEEVVPEATDFERLQAANKKGEGGPSPLIIIAAVVMVVMFVGVLLMTRGDGGGTVVADGGEVQLVPVEINVSCLDAGECRRNAVRAWERSEDLYDSRDVEAGNLFDSYKRLLEAKAYLEAGGIAEIPSEMSGLEERHVALRQELDELFAALRMRYHQAESRQRNQQAVDVLREINSFFPDRTSQEARWVREKELELQSRGILRPGQL